MTIFLYSRLPQKKLHNLTIFLYSHLLQKKFTQLFRKGKKFTRFYPPKKITCLGYVANLPTCGPLLILSSALKRWRPADGRGYIANVPICGPLVILSPAMKHRGPQMAGLCSQSAHLWATLKCWEPPLSNWRYGLAPFCSGYGPAPFQLGIWSGPWSWGVGFPRFLLRLLGVPKVVRINMLFFWPHPSALVATERISICATACSSLRTACRSLWALSACEWISFLPLSQLNACTNVGHGPIRTLNLGVLLFLVLAHGCWPWPYQDSSRICALR